MHHDSRPSEHVIPGIRLWINLTSGGDYARGDAHVSWGAESGDAHTWVVSAPALASGRLWEFLDHAGRLLDTEGREVPAVIVAYAVGMAARTAASWRVVQLGEDLL